jgi:hypothetical protein
MATPLSIETRAGDSRNPWARIAVAREHAAIADPMLDRPPIPRGVVDWPDELPLLRAGDPATGEAGPAPFDPVGQPKRRVGTRLDAVLFGAALAAFLVVTAYALGSAAPAALAGEESTRTTVAGGKVPVVQSRVLSIRQVIETALHEPEARAPASGG